MQKKNILKLYPEDFENLTIWEDICNILKIDEMASGVAIEFISIEELTESSLEEIHHHD